VKKLLLVFALAIAVLGAAIAASAISSGYRSPSHWRALSTASGGVVIVVSFIGTPAARRRQRQQSSPDLREMLAGDNPVPAHQFTPETRELKRRPVEEALKNFDRHEKSTNLPDAGPIEVARITDLRRIRSPLWTSQLGCAALVWVNTSRPFATTR
jgi:hypothetical protein